MGRLGELSYDEILVQNVSKQVSVDAWNMLAVADVKHRAT